MRKIPFSVYVAITVILLGTAAYIYSPDPPTKTTQTLSGDNGPTAAQITKNCVVLSARYDFSQTDKELCGKYLRSEYRAKERLAELRKNQPPRNYCEAKEDFQDAYDLERWVLNDAAFRMERIGVKDDELRDRRILTARMFAAEINRRIQIRNYDGTNCGVPLFTDNFVFARHPSITVTEFGHIGADYEEVRTALYWRRMQNHGLMPHYRELPAQADVEAARKAVDAAYDKKYGKH